MEEIIDKQNNPLKPLDEMSLEELESLRLTRKQIKTANSDLTDKILIEGLKYFL